MRLKLWGTPIGAANLGTRQVATVPTTKAATPPIQFRKFCQNGAAPSAQFVNLLHEATNAGVLFRAKQLFAATGCLGTSTGIGSSSAGGTTARWRGAFHLGPYSTSVLCRVFVHPQDGAVLDASSYAEIKIYSNANEATLVATGTFYFGASPTDTSTVSGWSYCKTGDVYIDGLTADTDYYIKVSDVNYNRIQSISVAELVSMTDNFDGYLPQNLTADSEVLSIYRENVATLQQQIWKRGAAKVFDWTVDAQGTPITRASATPANVIDTAVTTVSTSSPGFTIDMTGKDRLSQTSGVPVVVKAFCKTTSGTGKGRIYLKNSAGTAVATFTDVIPTVVPEWISTTATLTADCDKYDIQFDNNSSGTISLYAVSVYEYET